MQWQDINYENDSFWVGRHTVVKNGIYDNNGNKIGEHLVIEDSAKTPQGVRELPLGKFLSNLFKKIYQKYINDGIIPNASDFIFYTKAGNPFYEQSLRKMYKSLARKLGIKEIGCYSLRHEMATYLAQVEKSDRATIKALMGWAQIIDTYFHTDTEEKQKAISNIDNQYENISNNQNYQLEKNNIIRFPIGKAINE